MEQDKVQIPVYEKIAVDIAYRIYDGALKVGDKINGRSTMSSEYHVSPETIRRAVKLLEDVGIVRSTKGSGTVVLSKEKAYTYLSRYSDLQNIKDIERHVGRLLKDRKKIDEEIEDSVKKILEYSTRLKNTNPLSPLEIEISESFKFIGKSIADTKFWQNTGATIVGIKRDGRLIISPGPEMILMNQDIIMVVGDAFTYDRVLQFLCKSPLQS